ncbi:MAG: gamma carbonic anhydrase family protein [Oscillospiraceae bacterium]|jgi:carbonic anhydrase/acetyltransferase-like protein (isoleucine patch superfamily)|nr:gamma carbonic anhydrase family protein [Oscillospiraceae bacterium]
MDLKTLRQSDGDVVILPGAAVVGDVTLGPDCSVWFNAVLRGDGMAITLGRGCNVQDCCVLHSEKHATVLGDWVSVGHGAVVHGAVVGDNTIVGMGATLLDFARIGKNCMVGAGAVVTGRMDAPDGSLVLGNPAKVVRPLTDEEIAGLRQNAEHYARLKEMYR